MIKSLFAILPDLLPRSVDEGNAIRSSGMKYLGKMQNLARQAPEDRQYGKQQLLIAIEYFVETIFQITHARNMVILSHVCVYAGKDICIGARFRKPTLLDTIIPSQPHWLWVDPALVNSHMIKRFVLQFPACMT